MSLMAMPTMPTMSTMSSMPEMTSMPSMASSPVSTQSTYGLTQEEIDSLKKQGVDFGDFNPYYNDSPTLTYASGAVVPVGQAKWLAKIPSGSTLSGAELAELISSTPNAIAVDDYSSKEFEAQGGQSVFWDPYDPNKKAGMWLKYLPATEELSFADTYYREHPEALSSGQPVPENYAPSEFEWSTVNRGDEPQAFSRTIPDQYTVRSSYHGDAQKEIEDDLEKDALLPGPLGMIANIAAAIPGPWQIPAIALSAANSVSQDDPFGAFMAVLPGFGVNLSSSLGSMMEPTLGTIGSKVASNALIGGLSSIARDEDFSKGALYGGVSGGLGSYLGQSLPSNLQWAASPLSTMGAQLASSGQIDWNKVLQNVAISTVKSPQSITASTSLPSYKETKQ